MRTREVGKIYDFRQRTRSRPISKTVDLQHRRVDYMKDEQEVISDLSNNDIADD